MKCAKCGKEIDEIMLNMFRQDGSDMDVKVNMIEADEETVFIETNANWTGYELSEEEQAETINCPYCGKYPFMDKEIQVYDVVRIVCFKK